VDIWTNSFKMADWSAIAAHYRSEHLESASGVEVILHLLVVVLFHRYKREIEVAFRKSVARRFVFFDIDSNALRWVVAVEQHRCALSGLYKLLQQEVDHINLEVHFRQIMDVVNALRPSMKLQYVTKDEEDETNLGETLPESIVQEPVDIAKLLHSLCIKGIDLSNVKELLRAVKVDSDAIKPIIFFALVFGEQATLQTVSRVFLPTYFDEGICLTDLVALCDHPIVTLAGFKSHRAVRLIAYHYECLFHALGSGAEPTQFAYQRVFAFLRARGIISDMPVAEEGAVTTATDAELIAHFYAMLFDAEHAISLLTTNPARFAELVAFVCKAHRRTAFDQMYTKILHLVLFGEHDRAWSQITVGLLQPLLELAKADELAGVKQDGWSPMLIPPRRTYQPTRPSELISRRMIKAGGGDFEAAFKNAMGRPLVGCMFRRLATPEECEVRNVLTAQLDGKGMLLLSTNPTASHAVLVTTDVPRCGNGDHMAVISPGTQSCQTNWFARVNAEKLWDGKAREWFRFVVKEDGIIYLEAVLHATGIVDKLTFTKRIKALVWEKHAQPADEDVPERLQEEATREGTHRGMLARMAKPLLDLEHGPIAQVMSILSCNRGWHCEGLERPAFATYGAGGTELVVCAGLAGRVSLRLEDESPFLQMVEEGKDLALDAIEAAGISEQRLRLIAAFQSRHWSPSGPDDGKILVDAMMLLWVPLLDVMRFVLEWRGEGGQLPDPTPETMLKMALGRAIPLRGRVNLLLDAMGLPCFTSPYCRDCGSGLTNAKSVADGLGPTCMRNASKRRKLNNQTE
jgi:hypothetical protein